MRDAGPTRRAVLGTAVAATIAVTVAGCDDGGDSERGSHEGDRPARERAYATTAALLARYDTAAVRDPALGRVVRPLAGELREHLTLFTGTGRPATPTAPPADVPDASAVALADGAQQASDERLTGIADVSPELARRLASTAACLAGHARLLRSAP